MRHFIFLISLLFFPVFSQAAEIVSPVIMLIYYVYETTHLIAAIAFTYGLWFLMYHFLYNKKEQTKK